MMWVKVAAGATVVALSFVAIFYVSRLPQFAIAKVLVQGTNIVDSESVRAVAIEKLAGTYGILIPHSNALFAPRNEIEKSIRASFPEIESVNITDVGFETLVLHVKERATVAVWCGAGKDTEADCYALDESGFIFMKESSDGYVRYFGAVSGLPAEASAQAGEPIGATFLAGDFKTLNTFVTDTVKTANRAADFVSIESNDDVNLAFVGGGVVRFVRTDDTQATLDNVASVFASQSFKTKRDFEYADFRFGNKVYVKFKGE